jgi:hypothetical protein
MITPRRTALVTGASAGIGLALARVLARQGHGLVLVARRRERLEAVAQELSTQHHVPATAIDLDLGDPGSLAVLCERLAAAGLTIDVLVNNAGYGVRDPFLGDDYAVHARELQVMLCGLTELCHRLAPAMVARGWGRILNVASIAGYLPPLPGSLYGPIKAYVRELSVALDMELAPRGVRVTALCPGFTRSEFHESMGVQSDVDRLPGLLWQTAEQVAEEGYQALLRGEPVAVTGVVNRLLVAAVRLVPDGIQRAVAARTL